MSAEKHGLIGKIIKTLMVIIFTCIGVFTVVIGSLSLAKKWYVEDFGDKYKWIPIVNIVFGCLLLTSPFFLSHKREGLSKVIKFLMAIVFVIIGIIYIVCGSIVIAKHEYGNYKWYYICDIVFGCLLFTSPFFLKKD